MRIISVQHADLASLKDELLSSVFVYPTETCYGIGCSILNQKLVDRIYGIKGRRPYKPLSMMVDSPQMFAEYGVVDDQASELIQKYLPGPLTLILQKTKHIPVFFNPKTDTVGIRMPDHPFCLELVRTLGLPLVTTSANVSGADNPYDVQEILKQFKDQPHQPDIIFDGGLLPVRSPSTVVEIRNNHLTVLRQGELIVSL